MDQSGESYELLFINDGSRDRSAEIIAGLAESDETVRLVDFSRNFGHQIAVTAGMDYAQGQAVVIIDADLQDPPEVIPRMLEKWREGYDVVYGKRIRRQGETAFKKVTATFNTAESSDQWQHSQDTGISPGLTVSLRCHETAA